MGETAAVPVRGAGHRGWWPSRATADALMVAAVMGFVAATLPMLAEHDAETPPLAPAFVLVGVAGVATLVRGRWPEAAALVASGATATYLALSYPYGPVFAFVVLPVYALARHRPLRRAAPLAMASLVLLLVHLGTNDAALSLPIALLPATAWVAMPFTLGVARRMVVAADERERAATAQRLVDAERLRLAQEVHDVVGHGLAAIQMQADIALHVEQQRPEQARAALSAISTTSGQALAELRETLRSTHPDGGDGGLHAPTPGLARARELCERVAEAGVRVDLEVVGAPRPLPTAADVAAYRVLQEALTNVVKHSPHPRAEVRIAHASGAVTLEVTNQDLAATAHVPGIGITGMRRRVAAVGGTLTAGPGAEPGTFTVRAVVPRQTTESR